MTIVTVPLGERSYDVVIETGLLADPLARLAPFIRRDRLAIVTDADVGALYRPALNAALTGAGIATHWFEAPTGEGAKSWEVLARLCDWALAIGVERSDLVVALGGGVIGDLTGFAAAILKRGCRFAQLPTTLLAQVDSSVGGKTAINAPAGKNMIGAFHQPDVVLVDPATIDTLPPRQRAAGYAEVMKYGLIDDAEFFGWCEQHGAALVAGEPAPRLHAIATSVAAKARIVGEDERETGGRRALLNLGHTFGHALEAETGFSERLLHGEAVGCGMALAARYSVRRGMMAAGEADRIAAALVAGSLPDTLRAAGIDAPGERLAAHMAHDKKASGGAVPFLLMDGIGQTRLCRDVALADVAAFLDDERDR